MSAPLTGLELPRGGGLRLQHTTLPAISAGPGKDDNDRDGVGDGQTGVATKTRTRTKKPSLYRVLLLNDDYTPMEFVVQVLQQFFRHSREKAVQIMMQVHTQGRSVAGVFPAEIAETKVAQVNEYARRHQHPLLTVMEEA